jgi:predicted outer membrane repeat protein
LLTLGATTIDAATYVVAPDGTGDFPTIQAAIDGVGSGDVIELTDGVFTGEGNRDLWIEVEGWELTIRSQSGDYERCVIDLEGTPTDEHFGFVIIGIRSSHITIEGLTVQNAWGGASFGVGALEAGFADVTVRRCRFRGNRARNGGAIHVGVANIEVYDSLIIGNYASHLGGGVFSSFAEALFVRCTISGNRAGSRGGGIFNDELGDVHLVQSVVWGNCADGAGDEIYVWTDMGDVLIAECSVIDMTGLASSAGGGFDFDEHTISVDPLFCDPASCEAAPTSEGDYHVSQNSPCLPAFSSCGQPIGALGEGCSVVPIEETSWGHLKEWYRAR